MDINNDNLAKKELNTENLLTEFEFEQRLRDMVQRDIMTTVNSTTCYILENLIKAKSAWAINRYYYQINISIKIALMSRIKNFVEKNLIKRILDHDGRKGDEGGIERWYKLTTVWLDRDYVKSTDGILPAEVRG